MKLADLGPFDTVLDVGGNVGDFAEQCRGLWPEARVTSFEPVPALAKVQRERAGGRWWVEELAVSDHVGVSTINYCANQHSASTMQKPGTLRRTAFGITDRFVVLDVKTTTLDHWQSSLGVGRALLKIDVEGHERQVLHGAQHFLDVVSCVICEVQQSPDIFQGSASPMDVNRWIEDHGLRFAGVLACFPGSGEVVQFDGVWLRDQR